LEIVVEPVDPTPEQLADARRKWAAGSGRHPIVGERAYELAQKERISGVPHPDRTRDVRSKRLPGERRDECFRLRIVERFEAEPEVFRTPAEVPERLVEGMSVVGSVIATLLRSMTGRSRILDSEL
jgi:hypothetical protein